MLLCCASYLAHAQSIAPSDNTPGTTTVYPTVGSYPNLTNFQSISTRNVVRTYTPQSQITDASSIQLASIGTTVNAMPVTSVYYDGLGRNLQTVKRKYISNGSDNDLIKHYTYDQCGRQSYEYKEFTDYDANNIGKLRNSPLTKVQTKFNLSYPGETPFRHNIYDGSPKNELVRHDMAGKNWSGSNKGRLNSKDAYYNSDFDHIFRYTLTSTTFGTLPSLSSGSNKFYNAGELVAEYFYDEDLKGYINYYDLMGRLIAVKQITDLPIIGIPTADYYKLNNITYYVYDDLDRLRFVVTPEAYKQAYYISQTGLTASIRDGLCYQYLYDTKGRLVEQQIPGKSKELFVYDKKDRLVLYQDGNMRANSQNKWKYTVYDALDRTLVKGFYSAASTVTRSTLASNVSGSTTYQSSNIRYYLKKDLYNEYPGTIADCEQLVKYTYDRYDQGVTYTAPASASLLSSVNTYMPQQGYQTRGNLMIKEIKILNSNFTVPLRMALIYDDYNRLTQQVSANHKSGHEVLTLQHDYSGDVVLSVLAHDNPDAISPDPVNYPNAFKSTTVVSEYVKNYNAGTITGLKQNINNIGEKQLFSLTKDDFDRVRLKSRLVADEKYTYNINDYLTGINAADINASSSNGPFFCEQLCYDQGFAKNYYNGNIAGIIWKGAGTNAKKRAYGYSYDELNRLTYAEFRQLESNAWTKQNVDFTTSSLSYDNNGNIKSMNHRGPGVSAPVDMDLLTYSYAGNSNQLSGVKDAATVQAATVPDFMDDANGSYNDYTYDANGNLLSDLNKGISSIQYNSFNKPVLVTTGTGTVEYVYDGLGTRLQKIVTASGSTPVVTDYIGDFQYENNTLKTIAHPEGRYRPFEQLTAAGTPGFYLDYFCKDHLGNVRTIVNSESVGLAPYILQGPKDYYASLEVSLANTESLVWSHLDDVREGRPLATDPNDTRAAELNATYANKTVGTAVMIRVMPGDQFSVSAEGYYDAVWNNPESQATNSQVATSLLSALLVGQTYEGQNVERLADNVRIIENTVGASSFLQSYNILSSNTASTGGPASYLNYIVFDERNNVVASQSGLVGMAGTGGQWNTVGTNGSIEIGQAGYLLVFTSSLAKSSLFWDKIDLTVYSGNVREENHYYPFGLTLSESSVNERNALRYNGKELQQELGLNWYDYGARMQDPQIGRWNGVDELADDYESQSPYNYVGNNPARRIDVDGRDWLDKVKGFTTAVIDNATGLNTKSYVSAPGRYDDAGDLNSGMDMGDLASLVIGSGEMTGGAGMSAGGANLTYASGGLALEVSGPTVLAGAGMAVHGRFMNANAANNLNSQKGRAATATTNTTSGNQNNGSKKTQNHLAPDPNAVGDHTSFKRGNNGKVYKYETYKRTKTGHYDPQKRYDGGHPDGTPGAEHLNKKGQSIPTPHVQGKDVTDGVRVPSPEEIPK